VLSSASLLTSVVALGTAVVAYGVASLLQAMAARRHDGSTPLMLSPLVLAGLGLDVVGFLCGAVALHDLPLFFVQGASAASILVTALLASVVLGERPDGRETLALPLVFAGLIGLAAAAEPGPASALPVVLVAAMLLALPAFAVLARRCWASSTRGSALGLAFLAGLAYGTASLAARGLSAPGQSTALVVAVAVVVVTHALLGVALVTAAMRRLPVNTVTSVLFATETVAPAAVGLLWLGDRTQAGLGPVALAGCVCIVLATALLSRPVHEATRPGLRRYDGVPAVDPLAG
jgi:drug/metabolite transporter (DMT)-like permease